MLTYNFTPFPELESERLWLRRIYATDADAILELRSNPETMKFIPRPLIASTEEALEHIKMIEAKIISNEAINWGITLKGNPKLFGVIGFYHSRPENFRSEIGYMLLPEFHRKGIVSEAIKMALAYGFDAMNLHSVEAIIDPGNEASAKVLEKNGFVREAHLKENQFFDGKFRDTVIYSLLKRNFKV